MGSNPWENHWVFFPFKKIILLVNYNYANFFSSFPTFYAFSYSCRLKQLTVVLDAVLLPPVFIKILFLVPSFVLLNLTCFYIETMKNFSPKKNCCCGRREKIYRKVRLIIICVNFLEQKNKHIFDFSTKRMVVVGNETCVANVWRLKLLFWLNPSFSHSLLSCVIVTSIYFLKKMKQNFKSVPNKTHHNHHHRFLTACSDVDPLHILKISFYSIEHILFTFALPELLNVLIFLVVVSLRNKTGSWLAVVGGGLAARECELVKNSFLPSILRPFRDCFF